MAWWTRRRNIVNIILAIIWHLVNHKIHDLSIFHSLPLYNAPLFTIDKKLQKRVIFFKNFQVHDKPIILHENPIRNIEKKFKCIYYVKHRHILKLFSSCAIWQCARIYFLCVAHKINIIRKNSTEICQNVDVCIFFQLETISTKN